MFKNIYKDKKIFVTGHNGFKGSWLSYWLNSLGAKTFGYSLPNENEFSHFDLLKIDSESVLEDIRDYRTLEKNLKKFNPDIIFHLAAQPLVRYSYDAPIETFETNIMGTANLLSISRELTNLKSIIIVTTDKCYKNKEEQYSYNENDELGGYDPYSSSKACTELITQSFRDSFFNLSDYNLKHKILIATARAGNVIGGGDWSQDRLIPDIIKATVSGNKTLIRNPLSTRPWQHVLESLSGYLSLGQKLLEEKTEFARAFNFGPQTNIALSVKDIGHIAQSFWDKIKFEFPTSIPQAPHEANLLQIDSSLAKEMLGWNQVWNESVSVEKTIHWYKNFYLNRNLSTEDQLNQYIASAKELNLEWTQS